jgi:hypothetical protein
LINNTESYAQKWDYVRENPIRAGLVSTTEDWPFQGEIVEIERPEDLPPVTSAATNVWNSYIHRLIVGG